jgi:hypothetical protein
MKEIILPLKEAIALLAKENWERDKRTGCLDSDQLKYEGEVQQEYEQEAEAVFKYYDGIGYDPDYPDHHLVKVQK